MSFFGRGDQEEEPQLARIEAGGIPARAEERLRALAAGDSGLFTSGLSVSEFALLRRLGPEPVAQVMGASVVRPGWQYLPALAPGLLPSYGTTWWSQNARPTGWRTPYTEASPSQVRNYKWHADVVCELDELTDAWNLARRRALDRLTEEALQVNADAVVGVRLHRGDHDLGAGTIEYVVTGTAVRLPGSDQTAWPTLTDVSVQDYWRLIQAGHTPVGLLASTSVVFASASTSKRVQRLKTTPRNQELEEITKGFQAARDTVRARLLGQVDDAHASGAVGVEFSHSVRRDKLALESSIQSQGQRGWHRGGLGLPYFVSGHADAERRGWVITMHAAGTAIRPVTGGPEAQLKTTIRMGGR